MTIERRQLLSGAGRILAASTMFSRAARSGVEETKTTSGDAKRYTKALNVLDFGAKGDAKADDTRAFQTALDECARQGVGNRPVLIRIEPP